MKKSLSFSFAIIALLLVTPSSAQVQTFIIEDAYHSGREFTFVTNGTDVIARVNVPDSTDLVFENEGRVAYLTTTEVDGPMSRVFRHEIPIHSLQYHDCAKTRDWEQESETKTEKLAGGVFKTVISPITGGSFASYSCATLHKLVANRLPDEPDMPTFFQSLDTLCPEMFFNYDRQNEEWHAYLYHTNDDGQIFAGKIIPFGRSYLVRPIGYGTASYPAFQNFCSTLINPKDSNAKLADQTSDFTGTTSEDRLRTYVHTYY